MNISRTNTPHIQGIGRNPHDFRSKQSKASFRAIIVERIKVNNPKVMESVAAAPIETRKLVSAKQVTDLVGFRKIMTRRIEKRDKK